MHSNGPLPQVNWWMPCSSNLRWNQASAEGSKWTSESTRYTTPLCWPYPGSLSSSGCLYRVNVFVHVRSASGSSHYTSPHSLCSCLAYSKLQVRWWRYWSAKQLIVGKSLSSFYLALFIYLLFFYLCWSGLLLLKFNLAMSLDSSTQSSMLMLPRIYTLRLANIF